MYGCVGSYILIQGYVYVCDKKLWLDVIFCTS